MKQDSLEIFQKIAPDLMGIVKERYLLLRHIADSEPVGRRTLSGLSGLSERVVRAHVDVLRRSGIVKFTTLGIVMQPEGKKMMPDMLECFLRANQLDEMQNRLQTQLHLKQVCIVPGNCDTDRTAKEELGRMGAMLLSDLLDNVKTVAISGGSTMSVLAKLLPESQNPVTVVPARGGIGNQVEYQANVIAATIAAKTGGQYHMIHIPDGLSEAALKLLLETETQTQEIVSMVKHAQVVLFGIGRADTMYKRRALPEASIKNLQNAGACGEALGSYCDLSGNVVHSTSNVGISLQEVRNIPHAIAVAGGAQKAEAILSVMRASHVNMLVTDEAAATAMLALI